MEEPVIIRPPEHSISRRDLDPDALRIVYRLHNSRFLAYITGGAVRDLLLHRIPKDFDIVTDARPGQIKKRFASCYIIGRRFRLAHVRCPGGKTIEVATFRRMISPGVEETQPSELDPTALYGTPAEDALRRDLTINALFYDPIAGTVIDYVGGLEDLERRRIRVIGVPAERFTEDPVRIWRVLRHAARLGFEIEEETAAAIPGHRALIAECPSARLYEELNKDLSSESGPVFDALRKFGILRFVLGRVGEGLEDDAGLFARVRDLLHIADKARAAGEEISPEEMYAFFFWPWTEALLDDRCPDMVPILSDALAEAGIQALIPRAMRASVVQILSLAGQMRRALRTGRWRHSLEKRTHFAQASRLCFIIDQDRFPEEGESFSSLFLGTFPGSPAPEKRRRRRRPRRRPNGLPGTGSGNPPPA
jgi:poly(A) polymerase